MLKTPMDLKNKSSKPCCLVNTLVTDKIMYAPNYDAKSQPGMEAAMIKVGKMFKGKR